MGFLIQEAYTKVQVHQNNCLRAINDFSRPTLIAGFYFHSLQNTVRREQRMHWLKQK